MEDATSLGKIAGYGKDALFPRLEVSDAKNKQRGKEEGGMEDLKSLSKIAGYGKDPLFWTQVIMSNKDIHKLERKGSEDMPDLQHALRIYHHPSSEGVAAAAATTTTTQYRYIRYVQIMGIIVMVDVKPKNIIFTIDDGTALINCIYWRNNQSANSSLFMENYPPIGALVKGQGRLHFPPIESRSGQRFKQERQIVLNELFSQVEDPNLEVFHWAQAIHLKQSKSYHLLLPKQQQQQQEKNISEDGIQRPRKQKKVDSAPVTELADSIYKLINSRIHTGKLLNGPNRRLIMERKSKDNLLCFDFESILLQQDHPVIQTISSREMIKEAILELVKKGYAYEDDVVPDLYGFVTHEFLIKPRIMQFFKRNGGDVLSSIVASLPNIAEYVRDDVRLRRISDERLFNSISRLVDQSVLYEVGNEQYSLNV